MGEYYYRKSGKNLFFFLSGDRVAMIAATAAYGAGKVWNRDVRGGKCGLQSDNFGPIFILWYTTYFVFNGSNYPTTWLDCH